MIKLLFISLLAIQSNCQKVIEISGSDVQRKIDDSGSLKGVSYTSGLRGVQSLGSLGVERGVQSLGFGGLQTVGVQPVAGIDLSQLSGLTSGVVQPVNFGYGLSSVRGLNNYGINYGINYGVNQVGVRPVGLGLVSGVQPALGVNSFNVGLGYGQNVAVSQQVVPVSAAVQQVGRTVEYRSVPFNDQPIEPQVVEVEPSDIPLRIHFKSRSSTIQLSQEHIPGQPGTVEHTQSQDEPSRVVHEVTKPVIQEVREVIQPYRQVVQEVQPVIERVHTVVAKGEGERRQFVAQPLVGQNYETVQAVRSVQPSFAVQGLAQQIGVGQRLLRVQQPVLSQSFLSQPALGYQDFQSVGVSQPLAFGQQPTGFVSVAQPVVSRFAVSQPGVAVVGFGSGSGLVQNGVSGLVQNRVVGLRNYGIRSSFDSRVNPGQIVQSTDSDVSVENKS